MTGKAIAIETSGRSGSVALAVEGNVLREEQFAHGLKHAAGIVSIIDRLVREQGWTPRDVEQVHVSAGPGSFTGLRVGITVAKTLAWALGARVVAVPTLRVLAENAPPGWQNLILVLDAKRDQIFTARYANESGRIVEVEGARLDTLAVMLARSPRPVHLLGEGIPYHRQHLAGMADVVETDESAWRGRAAVVAKIGWELAGSDDFTDPEHLTPIYIRRPEAEEKWNALHKT